MHLEFLAAAQDCRLSTPHLKQLSSVALAWLGLAWPGLAWLGLAWLGLAWFIMLLFLECQAYNRISFLPSAFMH